MKVPNSALSAGAFAIAAHETAWTMITKMYSQRMSSQRTARIIVNTKGYRAQVSRSPSSPLRAKGLGLMRKDSQHKCV